MHGNSFYINVGTTGSARKIALVRGEHLHIAGNTNMRCGNTVCIVIVGKIKILDQKLYYIYIYIIYKGKNKTISFPVPIENQFMLHESLTGYVC